jgi:SAM-dependent methyltransferase
MVAITSPGEFAWLEQPDAVLLAQGRASGQGVRLTAPHVLADLTGLTERLGRPGAAILDVGTGVAALAAALAELFPAATVTGLDVSERVLALARTELADNPVADRVRLRRQDIATLDERETYDLAWIPVPFIAHDKLTVGVAATAAALRQGGWLLLGHRDLHADQPLDTAVARLVITAWGGTALTTDDAQQLLATVGLTDVTTIATPPGAPAMTAGRRP